MHFKGHICEFENKPNAVFHHGVKRSMMGIEAIVTLALSKEGNGRECEK
jgi:hypothetical protein